jgi:hypothetical protein
MTPVNRRRWLILATVLAALLSTTVVTAVAMVPGVAAYACPGCYGLTPLGGDAFVEEGRPAAEAESLRTALATADRRLSAFYGGRTSSPRVLICVTAACYQRIGGGGEKGRALYDRYLMLAPAGANDVIATHELSHVEFDHRLGAARERVPMWFDEGLAVLVAEDARYLLPAAGGDRCMVPYAAALAVTAGDFRQLSAGGNDEPYRWAACVVSRWAAGHGGPDGVRDLITRLVAGERFGDLVVP